MACGAPLGSCQAIEAITGKFPHMKINNDVVEAIGNTPLIKLKRASEATGCTILGKAEFMNPGQSVKDRAGKWMILEAEKRGDLKPGGLVLEATAGNTGIGLAVVASARGYRTLILIPETQSQEKKDMLRLCGAELVEVPALPYCQSEQLPARRQTARRAAAQERAERRVCSPTSGTTSITPRRITNRPAPKSGSRPAARSTASSARSAPAARWPAPAVI